MTLNISRHARPPDAVAGSGATLHYALVSFVDGCQGRRAEGSRYDRATATVHYVIDHGKFIADRIVGLELLADACAFTRPSIDEECTELGHVGAGKCSGANFA